MCEHAHTLPHTFICTYHIYTEQKFPHPYLFLVSTYVLILSASQKTVVLISDQFCPFECHELGLLHDLLCVLPPSLNMAF